MKDELLKKISGSYTLICLMEFGSNLYGTSTEASDKDYKGVYLPTKEQLFLQNVPKSVSFNSKTSHKEGEKNTKDDCDIEIYSLHYFLELCLKGETIGIDMLHCPNENLIIGSLLWSKIRMNRHCFYTNNLKGFVGYCRKQAAKYGIKGSRISDARKALYNLECCDPEEKLGSVWKNLPTGEHIHFVKGISSNKKEEEFYQVCGKKFQKTSTVSYCANVLKKFIDSYGHRALLAEKNEGLDWKAVSHAMRYGLQIKELFETNDIKFPLKDADYLRDIKQGKLNYLEDVAPKLEFLMDEVEALSLNTKLPDKPDKKWVDNFILQVYNNHK